MKSIIGLLLLGSLALPAQAADIYRWTDDEGRVNYGNVIPERYKTYARKIDTSGSRVAVTDGARPAPSAEVFPSSSTGSSQPSNSGSRSSAGY